MLAQKKNSFFAVPRPEDSHQLTMNACIRTVFPARTDLLASQWDQKSRGLELGVNESSSPSDCRKRAGLQPRRRRAVRPKRASAPEAQADSNAEHVASAAEAATPRLCIGGAEQAAEKPLQAVIPSGARNLALSIFNAVRDSSSSRSDRASSE